jgi:hypothetical protein
MIPNVNDQQHCLSNLSLRPEIGGNSIKSFGNLAEIRPDNKASFEIMMHDFLMSEHEVPVKRRGAANQQ